MDEGFREMKKVAPEFNKPQRKEGGRVEWGEEAVAGSIIWQTQTAPGLLQRSCNDDKRAKYCSSQDIAASAELS